MYIILKGEVRVSRAASTPYSPEPESGILENG
jgi:hypothetical protein